MENNIPYGFRQLDVLKFMFVKADDVFTKEECEEIINMNNGVFEDSKTNQPDEEQTPDIRVSSHAWINPSLNNTWLFQRIENVVRGMNEDYFRFELSGFAEPFQLTKYTKGGKYRLHMDTGGEPLIPRKLSAVVLLSDPDDFEGGDLQILCSHDNYQKAEKKQGSIIVFPSFLLHEVLEVTKGTRYSLISWVGGPSFK
jgi:PKHD-type hydroxylase